MSLSSALLATIPVILIILLLLRRRRRRWRRRRRRRRRHLPAARGLLVLGSLGIRRWRQWCTGGQLRRWSTGRWRRLNRMPHRLGRAARFLTSQRERCGWCYGCGGDSGSAGGCGSSTLLCKQLSERAHANAFGHGRPRRPARAPAWRRRQQSAQRGNTGSTEGGGQVAAIFYYKMYTADA